MAKRTKDKPHKDTTMTAADTHMQTDASDLDVLPGTDLIDHEVVAGESVGAQAAETELAEAEAAPAHTEPTQPTQPTQPAHPAQIETDPRRAAFDRAHARIVGVLATLDRELEDGPSPYAERDVIVRLRDAEVVAFERERQRYVTSMAEFEQRIIAAEAQARINVDRAIERRALRAKVHELAQSLVSGGIAEEGVNQRLKDLGL